MAKVFYYGLLLIPAIIDYLLSIKNPSAIEISNKLEALKNTDNICKLVFLRAQTKDLNNEVWVKKQAHEEQLVALRVVNEKIDEEFTPIENDEQRGSLENEKANIENLLEQANQERLEVEGARLTKENEYASFLVSNFTFGANIGNDILSL